MLPLIEKHFPYRCNARLALATAEAFRQFLSDMENQTLIQDSPIGEINNGNFDRYLKVILSEPELYQSCINIVDRFRIEQIKQVMILAKEIYTQRGNLPTLNELIDSKDYLGTKINKLDFNILNPTLKRLEIIDLPENTTHYKEGIKRFVRKAAIEQKLYEMAELANAKGDETSMAEIEGSLGLSNPFDKKTNQKFPDVMFVEDILAIDMEQILDRTALINNGFMCRGEMSCLVADHGSGKSIWANQLGIAWANGKATLGLEPYKGRKLKTMILNAEDMELKQKKMFTCIVNHLGVPNKSVLTLNKTFASYNQMLIEVHKECESFKPDIIVVNPLYKFVKGGTMNSDEVMMPLIAAFETLMNEFNCHVLFLHHYNKSGASFGSSVMNWHWRSLIELRREGNSRVFVLDVKKRAQESGIHMNRIKWSDDENELFWYDAEGKADSKITQNAIKVLKSINSGNVTVAAIVTDTKISKSSVVYITNQEMERQRLIKNGSALQLTEAGNQILASEQLNLVGDDKEIF